MENWLSQYVEAGSWARVGLIALALVLAALLTRWLLVRISTRAMRNLPMWSMVLQHIRGSHALLLPAIAVLLVLHAADDALPGIAGARHTLTLVVIAAITWLCMRAIAGIQDAVIAAHPATLKDNLFARRIHTQTRVLARIGMSIAFIVGLATALTTFPGVRQIGASLLASAGLAGLVAGFAARPVLGNLIAGLQIGLTQPIRLDDVVIVEGEWGRIEEITGTYVVVHIWDQRRLIVPLQWWIEHPFQNWTRTSAELIGTVFLWVDYRMPLEPLREALRAACEESPLWDRRTALLQVTEAGDRALQLRALVTAANSPDAWDLRCHVRERLVSFIQREYPQFLPRLRADIDTPLDAASWAPAPERAPRA
jgi:small-conductance mechanosensitive channel